MTEHHQTINIVIPIAIELEQKIKVIAQQNRQSIPEFITEIIQTYLQQDQQHKSSYDLANELGIIGCFEDDAEISTHYKLVLTKSLEQKYGYSSAPPRLPLENQLRQRHRQPDR